MAPEEVSSTLCLVTWFGALPPGVHFWVLWHVCDCGAALSVSPGCPSHTCTEGPGGEDGLWTLRPPSPGLESWLCPPGCVTSASLSLVLLHGKCSSSAAPQGLAVTQGQLLTWHWCLGAP